MRTYRNIRPEEVAECKAKFDAAYPWGAEPRWEGVKVLVDDGKIIGFVGFQTRILVEPLYAESPSAAYAICYLADGSLQAVNEYEWFIPDNNPRMQHAVERQFGIVGYRELPGKIYRMDRGRTYADVGNTSDSSDRGRPGSQEVEQENARPKNNTLANAATNKPADATGHEDAAGYVQPNPAVCANADKGRD